MSGGFPFETVKSAEGELLVSLKVPLTYENAAEIWQNLSGLIARKEHTSLVLDFSGVSKVDSAGTALLRSFRRICDSKGVRLRIESIQPPGQAFSRLPGARDTRGATPTTNRLSGHPFWHFPD